jgi:trehalose-phosphatase
MKTPHPAVERLRRAHADGRHLVLMFDFDGTLAPYADHPRLARLPRATRTTLERLVRCPNVTLGVVSGRSLESLREVVGLRPVYYAGTGGLELDMLGVRITHPEAERGRAVLAAAAPRLRAVCAAFPGAWVEDKPLGLTAHYRRLTGPKAAEFRRAVVAVMSWAAGRLNLCDCARAIEVTPTLGWTKASAVRAIVDDAARNAFAFYAGDEANDADALAEVAGLGGVAVGVGPCAPEAAPYRLDDPAGLAGLLADLFTAIGATRSGAAVAPDLIVLNDE